GQERSCCFLDGSCGDAGSTVDLSCPDAGDAAVGDAHFDTRSDGAIDDDGAGHDVGSGSDSAIDGGAVSSGGTNDSGGCGCRASSADVGVGALFASLAAMLAFARRRAR